MRIITRRRRSMDNTTAADGAAPAVAPDSVGSSIAAPCASPAARGSAKLVASTTCREPRPPATPTGSAAFATRQREYNPPLSKLPQLARWRMSGHPLYSVCADCAYCYYDTFLLKVNQIKRDNRKTGKERTQQEIMSHELIRNG